MNTFGSLLVGLVIGMLVTFWMMAGLSGAIPKSQMEEQQRACVQTLNTLLSEADSLRYVLLNGHSECKHWVLEYE